MRRSLPLAADGSIVIPKPLVEEVFGKAREAVLHIRTGCLVLSPIFVDMESGQLPQILGKYASFQDLNHILSRHFSRGASEALQFEGDLSVLSLSDVFLFLSASRKTGVLQVQEESRWGFFLQAGNIVYAAGDDSRLGLAAHLLRRQFITEQDLVEGMRGLEQPGAEVFDTLHTMSGLTPEEFREEWAKSVEEILFRVFTLGRGKFFFQNGEVKAPFLLDMPLSTTNYVMEAARRIDEWGHLQDRIPPLDAMLVLVEDVTASAALSFEEEQVLGQVTGQRTVQEVLLRAKVGELEGKKAVVSLIAAGLLAAKRAKEELPAGAPSLSQFELQLLSPKIETYNGVFTTVYQALHVEIGNKARVVVSAFFKGLEPKTSVLAGSDIDDDGALVAQPVLANLATLPPSEREAALVRDLNEMLYFQLFAVKNALGPEMEAGIVEMAKTLLAQ